MESSSGNSSDPHQASRDGTVAERTQICLNEIRAMEDEPADTIILMGRTGVGKSALLEYLTGASGHSKNTSNAVTLQFQIEFVVINGKKYYIMDTPGFDTDREHEVFAEIVRGINAVRRHARIIGVLLVSRINDSRAEAVDKNLVHFVREFCGEVYLPQVTIVTTFWNVYEDEEKNELNMTLEERLQSWNKIFRHKVMHYQHGRRYENSTDTGIHLRWRQDRSEIQKYAKEMIYRQYGNIDSQDPQIIQELAANISLENTAAGKFLRFTPTPGSSSGSSSPSSSSMPQQSTPENQSQSGTKTPEDASRPSASTNRAPQPEARPPEAPQPERGWGGFFSDILRGSPPISFNMNASFGNTGGPFHSPPRPPMGDGRPMESFPAGLDWNSSVDHFKARNMDPSLENRTTWARQHGIHATPGTAAFGNEVRRALMREHPL